MTKVGLSDIFKGDFLNYITAYKKRIQTILGDYDVAIFMARKAICFYDALRYNNEISEDKCRVISSRVLDYNTLNDLKDKKIAVIDDVVVRGKSLTRVASILYEAGIKADYYVVACEERFCREFNNNEIILDENFNIFSSSDIYQLSGAITKYIEASMRTFNVDSPIFDLSDSINDVKRVLNDFGAVNLTTGLQSKYGIESEDIYFKLNYTNKNNSIIANVLENSIFKIRFYYNDKKVVAVPFVLMPACNISVIQSIYNLFKNDCTDYLIKCENNRLVEENRLKLVSYLCSSTMFIEFANKVGFKYKKDMQNEIIQFNYVIDEIITDSVNINISSMLSGLSVKNVEFSKFKFNEFVKLGYQYVSSEEPEKHNYEDFKKQTYGSDTNDRLSRIAFSYSDMAKWINNHVADKIDTSIYISSVVDVFIDMGLIVPAILHIGDEIVLRAYKMGEYSKLTRDQINAFICMLYRYMNKVNRDLGKTELEKLCVLFFKKQLSQGSFIQAESYEQGYYGIAYSYYGPRVSTSNTQYEVSKESAIVSDFCDSKSVKEINEKYHIEEDKIIEDEDLKEECMQFAYQYGELSDLFDINKNGYWCSYIHTLSHYLIMLAIGKSSKNKVLSLCAEIQFIRNLNDLFTARIKDLPVKAYKGYLSGINSGLWKYICYKEDALNKTYEQIKSINLNIAYNTRPMRTADDRGDAVEEFIDECGIFLFKSAYIINTLLYYTNRSYYFLFDGKDEQCLFTKAYYYYEPMEYLRLEIKKDIDEKLKSENIYEVALKYNNELTAEAKHIIEKCDLYLEKSNARIMDVKKFLLVRSLRGNLPLSYKNINLCDLENVSKSGVVQIISIHQDDEISRVLNTMIENTKTIDDCEYVLIDLSELPFGYAQVEKKAKGFEVKEIIKEILDNKIGGLSYTFKTLYVYQKSDEKYDAIGSNIQLIKKYDNVDKKGHKLFVYSVIGEDNNDIGLNSALIVNGNNTSVNIIKNIEGDQIMGDKRFNASVGGNGIAISGEGNDSKITYTNIEDNGIDIKELLEEFKYVIGKIKQSDELDENEKNSLISVMTRAKDAVENDSENEIKEVKSTFNVVWGFVKKAAPSIISILANCAQISSFFGIHL